MTASAAGSLRREDGMSTIRIWTTGASRSSFVAGLVRIHAVDEIEESGGVGAESIRARDGSLYADSIAVRDGTNFPEIVGDASRGG